MLRSKLKLFSRQLRKTEDHTLGSSHSFFFGATSSGRPVTERSAMQMTAVYSCVRILAEAIAGLPLHVYKQDKDGSKHKALDHPLYRLLHDEPNPEMTSFVFRETLMTHLLLWGNAFAQVLRNGWDEVIGLYPLMLNRMTVGRDEAGGDLYLVNGNMLPLNLAGAYATGQTTESGEPQEPDPGGNTPEDTNRQPLRRKT